MDDTPARVAVICDDVEAPGGAAAVARASIRQLRRLGIPVTALAGRDLPEPGPGLECVDLGGRHILSGNPLAAAMRGLHDGAVAERLFAWIAANDTPGTVYHLHNWHKVLSPACFGPLARVSDRLLCSAHDYFLACPNGAYYDFHHQAPCELAPMSAGCLAGNCDKRHRGHKMWRLARHAARLRQLNFRRSGARVVAVHDGMLPYLERGGIPRSAIEVLRNPTARWCPRRIPAERNRALLFVGRLEVDKGVVVLARAAARLGARLVVVGDGPLSREIPRLCPGAEMLGHRPAAELAAIAATARLLVLPSLARETFGMVTLEAATSGLPVVTSTQALITGEMVACGAGAACEPDDVDGLAALLAGLLADDDRVAGMSRCAFGAAPGLTLTEDAWGDRLAALYSRVLAGRAAASGRAPHPVRPAEGLVTP